MEIFFSIMFIIIALDNGVLLVNSEKEILLEQNEYFFTTTTDQSFTFDSDESDITKITNIGFKFIDLAFSLEFPHSNKFLNLAILNSVKFWQQNAYRICQLLQQQQNYNIVCIDGISTNQKKYSLKQQKEIKKYQINILENQENQEKEQCKELAFYSENQIIVVCTSKIMLKVYRVDLDKQFSTQVESPLDFDSTNCSSKLLYQNQNIFFVFYDCENWKIIDINNADINIIMDQKLLQKFNMKNEIKVEYLSEIFACYNNNIQFYLVEFTKYYIFQFTERSFIYFSKNFETAIIKMIIFNNNCFILHIILFSQEESNQTIQYNNQQFTITLHNKDQQNEFHATSEFLFLRQNNQLNLILCQFLNQTYEILSSKIYFLDQYQNSNSHQSQNINLFYQIEESTSKVIFYEYQNRLQVLKPKKAYLHQILGFTLFTNFDNNIITQKIVFAQDLVSKIHSFDVLLQNDCSQKLYSIFLKRQHGLPYDYELIKQKQQDNFTISIDDEDNFYISGQDSAEIENIFWTSQFKVNKIDKFDLYLTKQGEIVFNFKPPKIKQIYSLNKQNISEKLKIFRFLDYIAIVNFQINQLSIPFLSFQNTILLSNYSFNQTIINITQCLQYLIFSLMDNTYKIFDIQSKAQIQVSEKWRQFGIPQFFFQKGNLYLIQFEQFIIHQMKDNFIMMKNENVQIFRFIFYTKGLIINTIHNQEDKVITYFSTGISLIKLYESIITTSKFVRPLILSHSDNYVSIASITNSQKSILIFSVEKTISIREIKYCSNFNFVLEKGILIYFNQEERLKIIYLEYYTITIQNLSYQSNHQDLFKQNFVILYQENNQTVSKQKTLNINIQNACYKLVKKKNFLCLFNQRSIVNVGQLFQGPITNIVISRKNIAASDLLNIYKLQDCNNQSVIQNNCIIQYAITVKSSLPYFNFQCIKNFYHCELFPIHIIDGVTLIKHKTIKNYSLQLNFVRLVDQYFIHLFSIDHKNFSLLEISFSEIANNGNYIDINIKDFLIKVSTKEEEAFLYFQNNTISKPITFKSVIDYDLIQNSDDLFLILESLENKALLWKVNCQIVSFKNNQKVIQQLFILENDFVLFFNSVFLDITLFNSKIEIIYSQVFQSKLEFTLFIILVKFSCEINIIRNFDTGKSQFQILKIIRNPLNEQHLSLALKDTKYIIISSASENHYIYNITQNLSMYDFFGSFYQQNIQLFPLNTTHQLLSEFYSTFIMEIKYEFLIEATENQINEKIFLIAQNQVSSEELEIIIKENQDQIIKDEKQSYFQFYILSIIIILVMIYFIRRKIIKQKMNAEIQFSEITRNETI